MLYLQRILGRDETLVYVTRLHWIVFMPTVIIFLAAFLVWHFLPQYFSFNEPLWHQYQLYQLVAIALVIAGIVSLLRCYIYYVTTEYGVTNRRVVMRRGWLQRQVIEVYLSRIEGASVNQNLLGQVFSYGTLVVIGTGGTYDHYPDVPSPEKFHQVVQEQINLATSHKNG